MELASHLEAKAAKLQCEGLDRIKLALAGMDTSSLLEILEGSFGCVDLNTSTSSASTETPIKKLTMVETSSDKMSEIAGKTSVPLLMKEV